MNAPFAPGAVVLAYVRGEGPMVATRVEPVSRPVLDDAVWTTAQSVHGQTYHEEREVTVLDSAAVVSLSQITELCAMAAPGTGAVHRDDIRTWFAAILHGVRS